MRMEAVSSVWAAVRRRRMRTRRALGGARERRHRIHRDAIHATRTAPPRQGHALQPLAAAARAILLRQPVVHLLAERQHVDARVPRRQRRVLLLNAPDAARAAQDMVGCRRRAQRARRRHGLTRLRKVRRLRAVGRPSAVQPRAGATGVVCIRSGRRVRPDERRHLCRDGRPRRHPRTRHSTHASQNKIRSPALSCSLFHRRPTRYTWNTAEAGAAY